MEIFTAGAARNFMRPEYGIPTNRLNVKPREKTSWLKECMVSKLVAVPKKETKTAEAIKQTRMGCLDDSWHRRSLAWTLAIDTMSGITSWPEDF